MFESLAERTRNLIEEVIDKARYSPDLDPGLVNQVTEALGQAEAGLSLIAEVVE
jgi:hypothetical protein